MSKHTELDCRPLHLLFHNELKYSQKNPFWQKINIFEIIFESKLKTQSLSTIIPETKFNILSNSALSCLGKWTFSHFQFTVYLFVDYVFRQLGNVGMQYSYIFFFWGSRFFFYQQILLFLSKNNTLLIRLVVVVESKCSLGIYSFF